jgi:hypothetical protein
MLGKMRRPKYKTPGLLTEFVRQNNDLCRSGEQDGDRDLSTKVHNESERWVIETVDKLKRGSGSPEFHLNCGTYVVIIFNCLISVVCVYGLCDNSVHAGNA